MALKFKEMHNRSFQADVSSITNVVLLIAHLRFTTSTSQRLEVKLNKNFISHYISMQHLRVLQPRAYACHFKYTRILWPLYLPTAVEQPT